MPSGAASRKWITDRISGLRITVGGVNKALSVHANKILKSLPRQTDSRTIDLQVATKRVFQALTETDQEGRSVRRPQRFGDLVQCVIPDNAGESSAGTGDRECGKEGDP